MSNENEVEEKDPLDELTSDLRAEDLLSVQKAKDHVTNSFMKPSFVKPAVKAETTPVIEEAMQAKAVVDMAKLAEEAVRKAVAAARFDPSMSGQVINKSVVPITDFSKMTDADVYDLSIPIEAKAFMSADVLHIKLKDTNYEARWVNKNPQNLGNKIAKGFTYISDGDLISDGGIQTGKDAEGHYCFDDVVAMKIDKATYYAALRAAHLRAVNTTDQSRSRERAAKTANQYMNKSEFSNDYQSAAVNKKMVFYDPGIEA